ncbi:endoribonuclease YbeY [Lactococcus hodotermopsidis]|uniref:Endoribonuclease YbeY n=1 Tax=Pseudolactococcus hodotermopsidis TaxID=2709157 RepID=A0A6A0BAZ6_9LACT|nr:rRNA maturation RNase YbeY [Lactococcus hodotermopsidis]GFH42609.1 endoribonuclease YbeY [Lactococcus hodotermopsidis]
MYIEITDKTGKVSEELQQETVKLLNFAAGFIHLPDNKEMAVTYVTNDEIQAINRDYRGKDVPTDVVSLEYEPETIAFDDDFDMPEALREELADFDSFIGELYISIEKAQEQADNYGHSYAREMGFLAVHGFLHINGYDHMVLEDEKVMFALQEEILTAYGLTR